MKIKKSIVCIIAFFMFLCMYTTIVNASSDFDMKSIDFEADLQDNGDMKIVETWNIDIDGETNTLFTNKEIKGISGITDVKVEREKKNGEVQQLTQIYEEQYHVDTDCFYALNTESNKYEIAWGVNASSGDRTYKLYYTVKNCVNVYNDCSDIAWKIMNNYQEDRIPKIHGVIKLPNAVNNIDNLKVWMHCYDEGEINRIDNQTVEFNIKNYRSDYAEFRITTIDPVFMNVAEYKKSNSNKLNDILSYEQKLADEANRKREQVAEKERNIIKISVIVLEVFEGMYVIILINKKKNYNDRKILKPTEDLKYFRDVPRDDATPAESVFLKYKNETLLEGNISPIIAGTMLDLSLQKFIEFSVEEGKKKPTILIKVNNNLDDNKLKKSEKAVLSYIKKVYAEYGNKDNSTITMKNFEKYSEKHNQMFSDMTSEIAKSAKKTHINLDNFDEKEYEIGKEYSASGIIGIILIAANIIAIGIIATSTLSNIVFRLALVLIFLVLTLFGTIVSFKIASKFTGLTQCGVDEEAKWEGLKKYMEEFSLLKEKDVPDLVLWEKYLVYATTFGISDKVIAELKVVYPQMTDENYLRNTAYMYWICDSRFSNNFVHSLNTSVNTAYTNSIAASGSGAGGGFSSGGGFSGGGGCCGGR